MVSPVLALPFTVISERDCVHLIAGEDFRYTFTGDGLDTWLPKWLTRFDGSASEEELLATLTEQQRESATQLLARLWGERILVEASVQVAHRPQPDGSGVRIFTQDTLDYQTALDFNAERLADKTPWLWITTGPMSRGYVGPVFIPHIGPCLGCLLYRFQILSPTPELYDVLAKHGREGGTFEPTPFPEEAHAILEALGQWKADLFGREPVAAAVFALHVFEVGTLEVSSHRVIREPDCPHCGERP